jgi:hypothetical protein
LNTLGLRRTDTCAMAMRIVVGRELIGIDDIAVNADG